MARAAAAMALILAPVFGLGGCAYTGKTNLPDHVKTVRVARVANSIDITGDVTNKASFKVYRPGLEVELRNTVTERIVLDGHLKVVRSQDADTILQLELLDFRRDPLRYNRDETIQEFRVSVTASAKLVDTRSGKALWESSVSGNASYFLSGELAKTEDEAVVAALEDLARHAVEGFVEVW